MKNICMLIPGNPALASHYYSWIEEMEQADLTLSITYATSYVLFGKKHNYIEYDLLMRKHYEDIFLSLSKSDKVTIIAHSVGSYFALRLLEKYPDKIEKVIIMFPYIGYSTISSLKYLPFLYMLDRVFPMAEIVTRCKSYFTVYGEDVHNISNPELLACLRFGVRQCTYFKKYKFDTHLISAHAAQLNFIYTEGDRWCPVETINLLNPISNHKKVDLPHDFIVKKENRLKMIHELQMLLSQTV